MALWTPADYGTQSALDWFDANDPAITLVSGKVSSLPNGGGYHGAATQATSGSRPTLTSSLLNGLPGMVFTGVESLVTANKNIAATPLFAFAVFKHIDNSINDYPTLGGVFGSGNGGSGDVGIQIFQIYDDGSNQFDLMGNGYMEGTPYIHANLSSSGVVSGDKLVAGRLSAAATNQIRVNGTAASTVTGWNGGVNSSGDVPALNGHPLEIGVAWSGNIYEICFVWGALTLSEEQIFEGYLAWKWGLQASLPGGHPYKSAAPTTGGGSVTGTLAATEAKDVAALAGVLGYSGALAATEVSDTAAITGTVAGVSGTLAATEAKDAASLAGLLGYSGTLAATEAKDTASIAGLLGYSGSLAATEAADAASISGTVSAAGATGTLAATEAKDTAAISGKLAYSGTLAATEAKDTAAITGALVIPITGTLAATEARDSASIRIVFFGGWEPTPPTAETWVPIPDNDEIWTPIASSAANWS